MQSHWRAGRMTTKSKDEKNKLEKDKGEKADKNKAEKGKADKNKGEKKVRKLHYERELTKLQRELVKLQEWVRRWLSGKQLTSLTPAQEGEIERRIAARKQDER